MPAIRPTKRHGLAQHVVDRIRALVVDGTYTIGARLPAELVLCDELGVGRSTLREAMRVLSSRGIIDVRHGDGTFVAEGALRETLEERLSRAALRDIYEARLVLELPLAELAAVRHRPRDISTMRGALKQRSIAAKNGDVKGYIDADFAFHLAIARAAKNPALFDLYASFVDVVKPMLLSASDAEYVKNENDPLHAALCDAIGEGQVTKVRRLVRSHLHGSRTGIEVLLERR